MTEQGAFPEPELDDSELVGAGLVAARSLLSERRRGTRRDLLIDSIVSFVATQGRRRETFVREGVRRMWATTTLTDVLFDQAIEASAAAGLLARSLNLNGDPLLEATETAIAEVTADREWVARKLDEFTDEVRLRLIGYPNEAELVRKANDVATVVVRAVAHGANDTDPDYGEGTLVRPVAVDVTAVRSFCAALDEPTWREPVLHLAEAAFDESDQFGNDIVHLLVVGSVVHALIAQRAGSARPNLEGTTLLLDASVLIDLTAPKDGLEASWQS